MGKELKRIPNKFGNICSGFFLTPSPPTSDFIFFPIPIVEENVCNTLKRGKDGLDGRSTQSLKRSVPKP